jgi:hypothetical protein
MKKILYNIFFLLGLFVTFSLCKYGTTGSITGKTVYSDIMPFNRGFPECIESVIWDSDAANKDSITLNFLYSKSSEGGYLADFFLPKSSTSISVIGGPDFFTKDAELRLKRDIDAGVFGMQDNSLIGGEKNFFSICNIRFESSIMSFAFNGKYIMARDDENNPKFLIKALVPFHDVKHVMKGKESIKVPSLKLEVFPSNALDALSSRSLKYCRFNFSRNGMEVASLGDLDLTLSYRKHFVPLCTLETSLGISLPFGNKIDNDNPYFFPPIVGNGKHFGIYYVSQMELILSENLERTLKMLVVGTTSYLAPNTQYRTFCLKNKPLSCYIPAYRDYKLPTEKKDNLCNFITFPCSVSPWFSFSFTTELRFCKELFDICAGYTMFSRQAESVEINRELPDIVLASGTDESSDISPVRSVSTRFKDEDVSFGSDDPRKDARYYAAMLRPGDIDVLSGVHPAILLGIGYLKTLVRFNDKFSGEFGGSFRYCHNNTAIRYKTFWCSLSYEF